MNYSCFFCGRAVRENGDICEQHKRKLDAPNAGFLRTRPIVGWTPEDEQPIAYDEYDDFAVGDDGFWAST